MCGHDYFHALTNEQRLLEEHGFENWPKGKELALYAFDLSDKLDALYRAAGMTASKDAFGRWQARRGGDFS